MKERRFIGIDPGVTGGGVVLDAAGDPLELILWDSVEAMASAVWKIVMEAVHGDNGPRIALEHTHANPKWSRKSCFAFGQWTGAVKAIAAIAEVPLEIVTVGQWQRAMLRAADGQTTKQKAACVARRLWPDWPTKHSGLTDAALIAEWLRRRENAG